MLEHSTEKYSDLTLLMIVMNPEIYSDLDIEVYQSELNDRNLNELEYSLLIQNYEQIINKSQDFKNSRSNKERNDIEPLDDNIDKDIFQKYNSSISPKYKFSFLVSTWLTLIMIGQLFNIYDLSQANFNLSFTIGATLLSLTIILTIIFIYLRKRWAIYILILLFLMIIGLGIKLNTWHLIMSGVIHIFLTLVFMNHKVNTKHYYE